jgi:hypothetical protein
MPKKPKWTMKKDDAWDKKKKIKEVDKRDKKIDKTRGVK